MTYEEKKKLIEAIKKIKDSCEYSVMCPQDHECDFKTKYGTCGFYGHTPRHWTIPTLTRWTPEDAALAKALKGFGAKEVYRNNDETVRWRTDSVYSCGALPDGAFTAIGRCESFSLDNIIKETEG